MASTSSTNAAAESRQPSDDVHGTFFFDTRGFGVTRTLVELGLDVIGSVDAVDGHDADDDLDTIGGLDAVDVPASPRRAPAHTAGRS